MKTVEISDECYELLKKLAQERDVHLTPDETVAFFIEAYDRACHERRGQPGRVPCHRMHCFELSEQAATQDVEVSTHPV